MIVGVVGCELYRELHSSQLDGELEPSEVAALERHLTSCEPCRLHAQRAEALHRAIRLRPAEPVPDLSEEIVAAALARPRRRVRAARASSAVAAAAVVTLLALVTVTVGSPAGAPMALAAQGLATPAPAGSATAVYLELVNRGGGDRLVGAVVAEAASVEIHTTEIEDDLCVMRRSDHHTIADNSTTLFAPGGAHLMLLDLHHGLSPGDEVEVQLLFERSEPVTLVVTVVEHRELADWSLPL